MTRAGPLLLVPESEEMVERELVLVVVVVLDLIVVTLVLAVPLVIVKSVSPRVVPLDVTFSAPKSVVWFTCRSNRGLPIEMEEAIITTAATAIVTKMSVWSPVEATPQRVFVNAVLSTTRREPMLSFLCCYGSIFVFKE